MSELASNPNRPARKSAPSRMQLNGFQQAPLWAMLAEAWHAHASREGLRASDSKAKEIWRKQYLGGSLGIWSLKQIPRTGPIYAKVMGKLQEVTRSGIDWIYKAGDTTPTLLLFHARQVLAEHDIPESYACGVARNACQLDHLPILDDLTGEQLVRVIRIVHGQGPRISAAAKKEAQQPSETNPWYPRPVL